MHSNIFWLYIFCFIAEITIVDVGSAYAVNDAYQALLPLPSPTNLDNRKVSLGEKLFHDPILSGNQSKSCASCHDLATGGDDGQQFSLTTMNELRDVNTPTVFNEIYNFTFTIVGSQTSLEKLLVDNLIPGKHVMNNTWPALLASLRSEPEYVAAFEQIYPTGISQETVTDAMLNFQHSLVTPGSRFDQFLMGNNTAISPREKRGYSLFKSYGCVACHQGKNIGGNIFQKFGLFANYFLDTGRTLNDIDFGRFNVTKKEQDRYYFRVPSLRNVELTAPYLHDGSIETLEEMIDIMGKYQLGREIPESDKKDIAAFLSTLTGQYKGQPLDR